MPLTDFQRTLLAELADARARVLPLAFIRSRPPDEIGCLYWSTEAGAFVMPTADARASATLTPHFGTPGGVLPQVRE